MLNKHEIILKLDTMFNSLNYKDVKPLNVLKQVKNYSDSLGLISAYNFALKKENGVTGVNLVHFVIDDLEEEICSAIIQK